MTDDDLSPDKSGSRRAEEFPDKLRVHTLARVLGTTSRRILETLSDLDGRTRSAHSSLDKSEADRVREALSAGPVVVDTAKAGDTDTAKAGDVATEAPNVPDVSDTQDVPVAQTVEDVEPDVPELAVAEPEVPEPAADMPEVPEPAAAEPDTREISEVQELPDIPQAPDIPETPVAELLAPPEVSEAPFVRADYMPLFVAPSPLPPVVIDDVPDDAEDDGEDDSDDTDDLSERPAGRRRRRGRRGRGRGRGEQGGPDGEDIAADVDGRSEGDKDEQSDESEDGDEDSADEDAGTSDGASRRRRRRRRRKSNAAEEGEANGSPDDPPNTVVHERVPRSEKDDEDEIQGITGSTRLEAKRQRRRDGRDAGRRRPPILSEAEFLARREAVDRVMVVRDKVRTEPPHEGARYTQIAVLEDGVLVEHFVTSAASTSFVGNIYLGIVQNVLPSMEAAFVDIGRGRNGVLYAGEVNWEAAGLGGNNRKIEQALKPGDYVMVQVSKDPVGHKGARLTTQISLAGRYLVYVPGASSTGISRKLPDTERQRLKEILREVVPSDAGVIIRTASEGVKEDDIRADVNRLQNRWNKIAAEAQETKAKAAGAAIALYEEPDVLVKVIRDLFNEDFSGLIISGEDAWNTINDYVNTVAPDLLPRLQRYHTDEAGGSPAPPDVFAVHRIDEQLAKAMDRKVWLPSGGTLVIDRTEAMTVVDVNTGKFTGAGGNLEETVTRNNLEAAEEVVRQLRLRDIGGIVVVDFIDMVLESNRDLVLRRLTEALGRDRTRHQVSEVTSLGLVQLTRKRLGTGLLEAFTTSCPQCAGRGLLLHADPVESTSGGGNRKSESSGSRRSKRRKSNRTDEPAISKVPTHAPGEHPLFKAMAAGRRTEDGDDENVDESADETKEAVAELAEEDLEDDLVEPGDESEEDEDESDEDESDEDEDEPDEDESDEDESDEDEDDEVIDIDLDEDDEELDDLEIDISDSPADDSTAIVAAPVSVGSARRPRRSAARPAGPPRQE